MEKVLVEKIVQDLKNKVTLKVYLEKGLAPVKQMMKEGFVKANSKVPLETLEKNRVIGFSIELETISSLLDKKEVIDSTTNYSEFTAWLREIADELDKLSSTGVGQA